MPVTQEVGIDGVYKMVRMCSKCGTLL